MKDHRRKGIALLAVFVLGMTLLTSCGGIGNGPANEPKPTDVLEMTLEEATGGFDPDSAIKTLAEMEAYLNIEIDDSREKTMAHRKGENGVQWVEVPAGVDIWTFAEEGMPGLTPRYCVSDYGFDGKLLKEATFEILSGMAELSDFRLHQYNDSGKRIAVYSFSLLPGTGYILRDYSWYQDEELLSRTIFNMNRRQRSQVQIFYPGTLNLAKDYQFDVDGSVIYYMTYHYDETGDNIEKTCKYDANDTLEAYYVREYDDQGEVAKIYHYAPDGELLSVTEQ